MAELLKVTNLSKHFKLTRKDYLKAVDDVSFDIQKGETLGLVGESGCGKSTLGRTLMGIYQPSGGEIVFKDKKITKLKKKERRGLCDHIQMIFQDPYASLNPRMTVTELIAEGWDIRKKYDKKTRTKKVKELLELVGLNEEHAERFPHEFSGGQRQRIGIARALSMDPEFIVCDEPISALDVSIQAQIMNLLIDLQKKLGLTYLFIAHDLSMVRYISDRIMVMYLGSVMEFGDNDLISTNPLHPYTQALFSAAPIVNPKQERSREQIILKDDIPSPIDLPPGCKFSSRCPKATEICMQKRPELKFIKDRYVTCHHVS
ncbi:ATP-binding cassette domain-containing protein [Acidaminobacter sp. JC074]|uniref:ABC transporter ATP-binding protein n=1 Tax=Acidaminobacter sp. JC074 TaxID=2530199 RepID=UPI001F0FD131|nr:oligopeptide/dipeptide ABC transporter ATP-binding protein [Acidaminobacter sp. JC074]MCH4886352.1 ATP-binding cassette domain-containing protein [Acidaminobacter sp. JC074]